MITAITPTGDRPLAFALCQNWMMRQIVQPDQWIVIDDGEKATMPFAPMEYVRREPQASDPKHTLAINLKQALPLIRGDKIIIIEDDEYYAPDYIAQMSFRLDKYKVVGIMHSKYYHVPSGGYVQMENAEHASLAETAFKSSFIPELGRFIENGISRDWLDCQIWRSFETSGRRIPQRTHMFTSRMLSKPKPNLMPKNEKVVWNNQAFLFIDVDRPLYLGIKGLPGRLGIGQGHNVGMYHLKDNVARDVLKRWVPNDYQIYLDIIGGKLIEGNYKEYFGWQ